jgi:hypothetical protein
MNPITEQVEWHMRTAFLLPVSIIWETKKKSVMKPTKTPYQALEEIMKDDPEHGK